MATTGKWTTEELTALRAARRIQPTIRKTELGRRLVKASRLTVGRPPAELVGLARYARILKGRTATAMAGAM